MKTMNVDVAIIGAGTGGLNARREVEKAGKSWVLIESGPYGTTCARVGCMPSKLLIAAAESAHEMSRADQFGIRVDQGAWRVDGPAVLDRVRRERDRFSGFVVEATEALPAEQRLLGHARFVPASSGANVSLQVGDHTQVHANSVVVATGSSPWIPPDLEPLGERVMVNDDVFMLEDIPESVAIFGTGIIGLELGQSLHRLGSRVTLFNPFGNVGPLTDPVVAQSTRDYMSSELDLQLGIEVQSVAPMGELGAEIRWKDAEGNERGASFTRVLAAAGRRPNVRGIGLEHAGVELDRRGVPTTDAHTMQAGDTPVFLAGDVSGHRPLLHEAADEGRIAGFNAARYPEVTASLRRVPLGVAFTDPQIGMVGRTFKSLEPGTFSVGEVSYDDQGRARVMGINRGLVRIYADNEDCRLVGAEMVGPRVEHTAHLLAWAIQSNTTVHQALKMPFYHPVIEEGIRTAIKDLAAKLKIVGQCPPEDFADAPGA